MSKTANITSRIANRLIIVSPLIRELETERLTTISRQLAALRDFEKLSEVAALIDAPIGRYYSILARNEWGDPAAFDIRGLYDKHIPRALLNIAQSFRHEDDLDYAAKIAMQALTLAGPHRDLFTALHAQKELAIVASMRGDHRRALALIEYAIPSVRDLRQTDISFATVFADYHNALAVELHELGRHDEARRAVCVALASPFVDSYPEWRETSNEIALRGRRPSRSVVAFNCVTVETTPSNATTDAGKVLRLPVPERDDRLAGSAPAN